MRVFPYQDGDQLIELVEKRELGDLISLLASEKSTRNHLLKRGAELERELKAAKQERADFGALVDKLERELNTAKTQRCDWKQDSEYWSWDTSCKQYMYFEYGPPDEQGYKFCHHCGATINFIKFTEEDQP